MSSSALRREAIPAAAMIFWRRSRGMVTFSQDRRDVRLGGLYLRCSLSVYVVVRCGCLLIGDFADGSICSAACLGVTFDKKIALRGRSQLLKFLNARQFVYAVKAEAHQKLLRGLVQNWAPDYLLASSSRDELA